MAAIALVAIRSVAFSQKGFSVFLRIDGSQVTKSEAGGSGAVNCQFYASGLPTPDIGNLEVFELIPLGQLSTGPGYAIRSLNYPQAFLRVNAPGFTAPTGNGSGTVNCQYYNGGNYPQNNGLDNEHFIIGSVLPTSPNDKTYYYIESGSFAGVFLRMDGSKVSQPEGAGSGTVNCQYYPTGQPSGTDDYEVFEIIYLQPPVSP